MNPVRRHLGDIESQRGVALMQFVVIITMAALLITVGYRYFTPQRDLQFTENFQKAAEAAHTAVAVNLLRTNGLLPCPDINDDGRSDPADCISATPVWGTLPYVDLGLRKSSAVDEWGSMLTYAVGTGTGTANICNVATADIGPGALTDRNGTGTFLYLLMSHGPNRSFAIGDAREGEQSGDAEAANCAADAGATCDANFNPNEFRSGPFNTGNNPDIYFDDIVSAPETSTLACLCSEARFKAVAGVDGLWDEASEGRRTPSATVTVGATAATVTVTIAASNGGQDCDERIESEFSTLAGVTGTPDSGETVSFHGSPEQTITYTFTIAPGTGGSFTVTARTAGQEARNIPDSVLTITVASSTPPP